METLQKQCPSGFAADKTIETDFPYFFLIIFAASKIKCFLKQQNRAETVVCKQQNQLFNF
jgi:hypothetical protein